MNTYNAMLSIAPL